MTMRVTTIGSSCSSTSSIPTSRSTRPSHGRRSMTKSGTWRRDGPRLVWPPYATDVVANGYLTERQAAQTRANYGSKLSMIDHWFGKVLDAIDRQQLWDDTAIIVCTDHGLFLGERDIWGKPSLPFYEPFGHTPLLVAWPGVQPGARRGSHDQRRHSRHRAGHLRRSSPRLPAARAIDRSPGRWIGYRDSGLGS